jgi:hypothetical protein
MTGYNDILRIKRIEQEAEALGFRLGNPKNGNYRDEWGDLLSVYPLDDKLPIYSRDAELFTGTLETFVVWMQGIQWARKYDDIMKVSNSTKRERKEQDELNKQIIAKLKDEELELRKK